MAANISIKTSINTAGFNERGEPTTYFTLESCACSVNEAFLYLKDFASSRQRWLSDFDRVKVGETNIEHFFQTKLNFDEKKIRFFNLYLLYWSNNCKNG